MKTALYMLLFIVGICTLAAVWGDQEQWQTRMERNQKEWAKIQQPVPTPEKKPVKKTRRHLRK